MGSHITLNSIFASCPVALGLILSIYNFFFSSKLPRFFDIALLREWIAQRLIVDQTHLVLANGKLVQQKYWVNLSTNYFPNCALTSQMVQLEFFLTPMPQPGIQTHVRSVAPLFRDLNPGQFTNYGTVAAARRQA